MENATRILRQTEAASYLNLSPRTLENWRYRGGGPKYARLGSRLVVYRREDLDDFISERVVTSTSDKRGMVEGASSAR